MGCKHFISAAVFCFGLVFPALSQEVKYRVYTIDDGLSQNMVQSILEDRQGFMWFGTKDGLNRFDGYRFKVYRKDPSNKGSLSDNDVTSIFEDRAGNLWVGTRLGGLNFFDRRSGVFFHLPEVSLPEKFENPKTIIAITQDFSGNIWVAGTGSLFQITIRSSNGVLAAGRIGIEGEYSVKPFLNVPADSALSCRIQAVFSSRDGSIYCARSDGIFRTKKPVGKNPAIAFSKIINHKANSIAEDSQGNLWFTSFDGLFCYDPRKQSLLRYEDSFTGADFFSGVFLGNDGRLWLREWKKPDKGNPYKPFINYFDPLKRSFGAPGTMQKFDCLSVYPSSRDLLWIGTPGEGVIRFNLNSVKFNCRSESMFSVLDRYGFDLKYIFFQNSAYVGVTRKNNGRLLLFNWLTRRQYDMANASELLFKKGFPGIRTDLAFIHPAFARSNGEIWASAENFYDLVRLSNDGKVIKRIPMEASMRLIFFEDQKGRLWVGCHNGMIYRLNEKGDGLTGVRYNEKSTGRDDIHAYLDDDAGNLWLGTSQGIVRLSADERTSTLLYKNNPALAYSILTLQKDAGDKNTIWIGTDGGGLIKFNLSSLRTTQYLEKNGLPNLVVYAVLPDRIGNLWLSTNMGLSRFDPRKSQFINFRSEDGLQANEFNRYEFSEGKDGALMFGGIKGTNYFYPDDIILDTLPLPMVLTGFSIFNTPVFPLDGTKVLKNSIEYTREIELAWDQNQVNFEFAALDFTDPQAVLYSWKMEGVDHDWLTPVKERSATYANLSPGHYTFMLRASNKTGIWSKKPLTLAITIFPPWWQTWWAYAAYILLFISVVAGAFRFRLGRLRLQDALKQEKQEAVRLQELDDIKSRFFSNITHELRTPLTLILGPLEQLKKTEKNPDNTRVLERIERNASRLLKLINELLDLNKLEAKSMKVTPAMVEIGRFLKYQVELFTNAADSKNIALKLNLPEEEIYLTTDPEKLGKIVTNLIGNALKFTPSGGTVETTLSPKGDSGIELRIRDTGIGIDKSLHSQIFGRFYQVDATHTRKEKGSGIGLALVKELLDLIGGSISFESEPGKGTEFTIHVKPLEGKASLSVVGTAASALLENMPLSEKFGGDNLAFGDIEEEPSTGKPLVLVIEDNADMAQYISENLAEYYDIQVASDGETGLEKALNLVPDLIVSDVMMPGRDGYEVTEILKEDERTSHVPIILLTAKTDPGSRMQGLRRRADAYIPKPFSMEELILVIRNLIEMGNSLKRRYGNQLEVISREAVKTREDHFILRIAAIVNKHIEDQDFGVDQLALEAFISRAQLHRKLKALTGHNTSFFIRRIRLEYAMELLKTTPLSVSEVAYSSGFNTPNYFSTCFHEYFGFMPSQIMLKPEKP